VKSLISGRPGLLGGAKEEMLSAGRGGGGGA